MADSNEDKITNIGVAAHITAASIGGPRYDFNLTPEERSAISNAVWLCQSCAKLIDSDPIKFPVELLKKWKGDSERVAESELRKEKLDQPLTNNFKILRFMPELINEMIDDFKGNPFKREFILQHKGSKLNNNNKEIVGYYYEDHENLEEKIRLLENNGLIREITFNNVKRYVLEERFFEELTGLEKLAIDKL